jgi:hypothetical protein
MAARVRPERRYQQDTEPPRHVAQPEAEYEGHPGDQVPRCLARPVAHELLDGPREHGSAYEGPHLPEETHPRRGLG